MTPAPVASAAGSFFILDDTERDNLGLYVVNATVHYHYHHDEDAWVQIPSLALAGVFGAGACWARGRWSNTITANWGSTTTVTTATAITGLVVGAKIRMLSGSQIGKEADVTWVIINPGWTNTIQFTPAFTWAVVNTDTFAVDKGKFFVFNAYATLAAWVFKSWDPVTWVATSLQTTGLPAAWGTEWKLVATPSDDPMATVSAPDIFTSTTLGKTGKTWTVNQWTNYQVRITSGLGIGQVRTIASNTATTLTVAAWTTTPDATSVFEIAPNDDFLYLLGNNAVTMYRYSISANTWTTMAPTTARAGAMIIGGGANFAWQTGDTNWANESDIKDGRYIYSFRWGATGTLDRFDIAGGTAGAWAWLNIAYPGLQETFTTGSSFGIKGRYVYCRQNATNRFFKYSLRGNYMEALATNLYPDGAALLGDKMWLKTYMENGEEKLTWLYSLRNTGTELHRLLLI
jgi:hypothetical protein